MNFIGEKYQVLRSLGSGAVGEVYLAKDLSQDDSPLVAVKTLKTGKETDEYLKEFFNREVNALKQLDHPGIVSFYGCGYDDNNEAYYLVLEYVEGNNLEDYISGDPLAIDTAIEIVMALLESLSYAHAKGVFHRDIKPANILMDINEKPKLADFGVSKVYTALTSGLTVRDFLSIPYAAPEQLERKPADAKTDIYLVGAVLYKMLTGKDPSKENKLEEIVRCLTLDVELVQILFKMVSFQLEERYDTASQALTALKKFHTQYKKINEKHYIAITNAAINKLYEYGFIKNRDIGEAKRFLEEELSNDVYAFYDNKYKSYNLIGRQTKLSCKLDDKNGKHLVLTKIFVPDPINMERDREFSFEIQANWNIIRDVYPPEEYNVRYLLDSLATKSREQQVKKQAEVTHKDMIAQWEKVLELQRNVYLENERSVQYKAKDLSIDGDYLELNIGNITEVAFTEEQPLLITHKNFSRYIPVGYYQDLVRRNGKNILVIGLNRDIIIDDIADQGEVIVDNRQISSILARQQRALKALKHKENVNPQLATVLSNPEIAKISKEALLLKKFFNPLDVSKREAVKNALLANDIFLIQGPPGTGKTTVISELVAQITSFYSRAKVLITSQSNVAVNHALMRISSICPELPMIRIGRREKIAQGAEAYSYDERLITFARKTTERSNDFAQNFKLTLNINNDILDSLTLLEEVKKKNKIINVLNEQLTNLKKELVEAKKLQDIINNKNLEITQLNRRLIDVIESIEEQSQLTNFIENSINDYIQLGEQIFDLISKNRVLKEYSKLIDDEKKKLSTIKELTRDCLETCHLICETLEISFKDSELQTIIKEIELKTGHYKLKVEKFAKLEAIRKEWLKRVENVHELEEICVKEAVVVAATCLGIAATPSIHNLEFDYVIVDEAGRATPPEVLVPIIRGKKIILVGDQKQLPPIIDSSLTTQQLKQFHLDRKQLEETLFEKLFNSVSNEVKCTLLEQYRMHPNIGKLVSSAFYDGQLVSKTNAEAMAHGLTWWPKTVLWLSTSNLEERFEHTDGTSKLNRCEAKIIVNFLEEIEKQYQASGKKKEIAIITGYTAQKQLLRTLIDVEDKKRWRSLKLEIDTVDAFQGRETDIVIYSLVRSNTEKSLGFIKDYRRLNVALSRAKQFLIIVGDHHMAKGSIIGGINPFLPVLNYISQNNEECALEVLAE
ncbi:Serine/threonine-protein kinase PrkC [Sporotomaculum syntrophicum]|uniref:Serine/threonine-protein kinase PrkC n=1 Tax=Sporotomaculum syntrophicum TaxID=182264 RepID=A0A9D3AY08_9FIRM|nr:AAA domain-containing protein [Sporotomaculum syntrophicum]KAF1084971.1 Serine/threonine-protein kinase PrkC [Sporotomaculum syntrophicum]